MLAFMFILCTWRISSVAGKGERSCNTHLIPQRNQHHKGGFLGRKTAAALQNIQVAR